MGIFQSSQGRKTAVGQAQFLQIGKGADDRKIICLEAATTKIQLAEISQIRQERKGIKVVIGNGQTVQIDKMGNICQRLNSLGNSEFFDFFRLSVTSCSISISGAPSIN